VELAKYYCEKRVVPAENIIEFSLGRSKTGIIGRADYETKLARPIREKLTSEKFTGKIKCLLTTFGVPFKVGPRGHLTSEKDKLSELNRLLTLQKKRLEELDSEKPQNFAFLKKKIDRNIEELKSDIARFTGEQTSASVDSELSMVLFGEYELYKWQKNNLSSSTLPLETSTVMVSRLDGPNEVIAKGLVDKALTAETKGLTGGVYIDSRGIEYNRLRHSFGYYDQSLRDLAMLARFRTNMPVKLEETEKLFAPGECPQTAIYCGWYSLKNYIDAFDFVDGAVGFHIASFEAADLRSGAGGGWCAAMLADGITATLGPVDEPYLIAFPEPKTFFIELFNGRCLVEAFYRTKPFNSWQLVLIGDPLYTPFEKR